MSHRFTALEVDSCTDGSSNQQHSSASAVATSTTCSFLTVVTLSLLFTSLFVYGILVERIGIENETIKGLSKNNHGPTTFVNRQQQNIRVLCVGDSLTAGLTFNRTHPKSPYPPILDKLLQNNTSLRMFNISVEYEGYPGWMSSDLLNGRASRKGDSVIKMQNLVERWLPISLVIIMAGTNDILRKVYLRNNNNKTIAQNVISLHQVCYNNSIQNTIAIGIPQFRDYDKDERMKHEFEELNSNLKQFADNNNNMATFVPFPFEYLNNGDDEKWSKDGVHFTPKGYQVLAESLVPYVEQIILKEYGLGS